MSNYDELIKKAQREIEKLTAGIEKSKARRYRSTGRNGADDRS